jgi:hypothetical protein
VVVDKDFLPNGSTISLRIVLRGQDHCLGPGPPPPPSFPGGAPTINDPCRVVPPAVAEMSTLSKRGSGGGGRDVLIVNEASVAPAGMVTEGGTGARDGLLLLRAIATA